MDRQVLKSIAKGATPFEEVMLKWWMLSSEDKDRMFDFFREAVAEYVGVEAYGVIKTMAVRLMLEDEYEDAVFEDEIDEETDKSVVKKIREIEEDCAVYSAKETRKRERELAKLFAEKLIESEVFDDEPEEPYWKQEQERLSWEVE